VDRNLYISNGILCDLCIVAAKRLQFFGGYGYMLEYPITRAYMDARVQRIFAGTSEIPVRPGRDSGAVARARRLVDGSMGGG
jgi:hypothetical protein